MEKSFQDRLDKILVKKGLVSSREKAKALILAGTIAVNGAIIDKAGTRVSYDDEIILKNKKTPYVSRGGLKLEKILDEYDINVKNLVFIDVGASTGGFTDCLLQREAKKVYAIDVGYGQLDWKLRQDPRVNVMEKTNIRYVEQDVFDETPFAAVVDVSFISLKLVLPVVMNLISDDGFIIALIKPQFEAGPSNTIKGVVRSKELHKSILNDIISDISELKLKTLGLTHSPIKGPKGNIEYLIYLSRTSINSNNLYNKVYDEDKIKEVVEKSYNELNV